MQVCDCDCTSCVPIYPTIPPPPPQIKPGSLGYNQSDSGLYYYDGESWVLLSTEAGSQGSQGFQGAEGAQGFQGFQGAEGDSLNLVGTPNQIIVTQVPPDTLLSIPSPFIPPGIVSIPAYLNVGPSYPPTNTTPGDLTAVRAYIGNEPNPATNNSAVRIVQSSTNNTSSANRALYCKVVGNPASGGTNPSFTAIFADAVIGPDAANDIAGLMAIQATANITEPSKNVGNVSGVYLGGNGVSNGSIVNSSIGLFARSILQNTGTVTSSTAIVIASDLGAVVERRGGIDISPMTGATSITFGIRLGVASGATTNNGIWFNSNTAGPGAGIVFGVASDTSLYRGTANQLRSPGDLLLRHVLSSSVPTVIAGAGAGASSNVTIAGSDAGFVVSITVGASPVANQPLFVVAFGSSFSSGAPSCVWSSGNVLTNALSGAAKPYISAVTSSSMTFMNGTPSLNAGSQYVFRFVCAR